MPSAISTLYHVEWLPQWQTTATMLSRESHNTVMIIQPANFSEFVGTTSGAHAKLRRDPDVASANGTQLFEHPTARYGLVRAAELPLQCTASSTYLSVCPGVSHRPRSVQEYTEITTYD